MGEKTTISWTGATVNPVLARLKEPLALPGRVVLPAGKVGFHCVKVSTECSACYAETFNQRGLTERGTGLAYTKPNTEKVEVFLHRPALDQVLRWQRPRRIFWCSMTDLFGEFVSSEISAGSAPGGRRSDSRSPARRWTPFR